MLLGRAPIIVVLSAGLVVTGLASELRTQEQATFRSSVQTVVVHATVRNQDGQLVPDLTAEAFEVFEDGQRREVLQFSRDPQPLGVAMMLDMSQGASWGTAELRTAVLSFVEALRPVDRMRLGSFGLQIAVGANLTRDRAEIARVLDEEMWKGGGTPLWQAIRAATASVSTESGRRAVVVVTDGNDTGGLPGFAGGRSGAEQQAVEQECVVYAVLFENNRDHELAGGLVDLTEKSGGGAVVVPSGADVAPAMARIADELRHQYLLGFAPAALDGRTHRLEVRLTSPGLQATSRRTYVARPSS
jgi:VWFA-related protein